MKNITILGWFGSGNFWDDIILLNEVALLQEKFPWACITVLCWNTDMLKQTVSGVDTLALPPIAWYRVYKFLNIVYLWKFIKLMRGTDMLILWWGGFFSDRQFFAIWWWLRYCRIAKYFWAKVVWFGMWAGPFYFQYNKNKISSAEKYIDYISVRDDFSLTCLREIWFPKQKLVRTIDPAFFLSRSPIKKDNSVTFILKSHEEYFIWEIQELFEKMSYDIKLVITDILDIQLAKRIYEIVGIKGRIKIVLPQNLEELIQTVAASDFVISQRLHGCIIAFTQQVPFLNIYYHHKGKELEKLLWNNSFCIDEESVENHSILDMVQKKDEYIFTEIHKEHYKNAYFNNV